VLANASKEESRLLDMTQESKPVETSLGAQPGQDAQVAQLMEEVGQMKKLMAQLKKG